MSVCLKINTNIKLLGLVMQVLHPCFDTVHRYLQPKDRQRTSMVSETLLRRWERRGKCQEPSSTLGKLLQTNHHFTATDAPELKLPAISADPIKKISFIQVEIKADFFYFYFLNK